MGSLGDDDGEVPVTPSKWDMETQIFDSQFSPSSSSGGKCYGDDAERLHFLQSTLPFDDTVTFKDGFETQVMNLDGETQVMNLGGETQVVNLGDETQEVDILDCVEKSDTQLFDDYDTEEVVDTDGEGTAKTEVLDDTEELADDDSGKRDYTSSVDQENIPHTAMHEEGTGKLKADARSNKQHTSGSVLKGFTEIRAASVRASGLAARNMASERSKSQPCSTLGNSQSLKIHDIEHAIGRNPSNFPKEVDLPKHNEQNKELRIGNTCRAGRPTARKLFAEDPLAEAEEPNEYMNNVGGGDLPPRIHSETELAGLSYIDSQEPGELSQANALDFVDRFLKVNVIEFDDDEIGKSTGGKSKTVSSAKGTQSLAKSANLISTLGERGIFDWDDNREDEGGGEFFRKKKEELFDNGSHRRKSFPLSRISCPHSKSGRLVEESRDTEQLHIHDKVKGIVCSDSKLVLANRKGNDKSKNSVGKHVKEAKFRKNLIKELDEQSNIGFKDGMAVTSTDKDIAENMDVRFDTQMAAEAMEALCFGVDRTDHESNKSDQGCNPMPKGSHKGQAKERAHSRQSQKRPRSSTLGVSTRRSKVTERTVTKSSVESVLSSKSSTKVRKQCDIVPVKELKKANSAANEHITGNGNENVNKAPSGREEISLKRRVIDEVDGCCGTASGDRMSVKKQRMQEQLGTFTPIACRTRHSVKANQSERVKDASRDSREEMNPLTGFYPKRRRTRQKLSVAQEVNGQSTRLTRSKAAAVSSSLDLSIQRKAPPSVGASPMLHSLGKQSGEILLQQSEQKRKSDDVSVNQSSVGRNGKAAEADVIAGQASNNYFGKKDADTISFSGRAEIIARTEASTREGCKPSASACTPPVNCATPVNEASPICMGDEYLKQSCRKNLLRSSLMKELESLVPTGPESVSPAKDSRKRRDMSKIRVLFSRHLDGDIIKQQKKILSRLGASVASSMSDATHFIADEFVRTRNMLEAIAFGKPVVTHIWLESCGQASCHIDEKNHILRDAKKEKEFGFSLPVSLARACQTPLLQGQKVLITPNTKPGKEILASLVKAVHGLAVERIGRTALKDDKIPDELLVLSCEEDYAICLPFLEKGATVYSSELLLNGIVTQKLDYERHRLFADHVKRTRSTIWLKKNANQYCPVAKCK